MQLLARAAGSWVGPLPEPEIGWCGVELTEAGAGDPVTGALPRRFDAFQWHYYTYGVPAGAVELARSNACTQAFRLGDACWGVQFHPEVTDAQLEGWLADISDPAPDPERAAGGDPGRRSGRWNEVGRTLCGAFLRPRNACSRARPSVPPEALGLALAAAVLHAGWNALLRGARDVEAATAAALGLAIVVFAPVAAMTWQVHLAAWPYVAGSAVLETVYFFLVVAAYRRRELSVVYPIARGSAPALVLLGSAVVLGRSVSAGETAGVCLVVAGVLLVRGLARRAEGLAVGLAIGCCIAAYTLVDKEGLRHASPLPYLELVMTPNAVIACGWLVARAEPPCCARRRAGRPSPPLSAPSARTRSSSSRSASPPPRPSRRCARRASSSPHCWPPCSCTSA